ncbi:MAG: zinc-dependent alcohol dehydrogenase [Woeseiaceae bacterium]
MRQAIMTAPGEIEFGEADEPTAGPGQVRIRIQRIGVCGSDIHVYHGEHPFVTYPLVQGHEYAGVVDEIGAGVSGISIGDKVTATPQEVCGKCPPCKRGQYNACEALKVRGFQAPGCAQDFFVTEADKIIMLPPDFQPEQGAFVEPVAVAAHSTARAGDLTGKNVVVSGAGTIGNFVAQACKCRGAAKVLIADVSDYRLQVAQEVGIDAICNVTKESLADAAQREFGDAGYEVAAEVAGVEASLDSLVAGIGKGGTLLLVGVFGDRPAVDMSVVCEHELDLKGSMMYRHGDFEQAVEWIASGEIQTQPLVSRHFDFEEFAEAYSYIDAEGDKAMKVMIDLE